jgi:hypothetical protein
MSPARTGPSVEAADQPLLPPRTLLIVGAASAGLALAVAAVAPAGSLGATLAPWVVAVRVLLIVAALVLAVAAVNVRLRSAGWEVEERAVSAGYLALAAFVTLLAHMACDEGWDTFRLLIGVMVGLGLGGAVLVLLPQMVRRGVILMAVLVHFTGILTAVFSVPPGNAPGCWLTNTVWTVFYRPYLQFVYLNNAYHFYSPEPGPPTLLWFRLEYADGSYRWVKTPNREEFPTRLAYQRRLALTESTNQLLATPAGAQLDNLLLKRNMASNRRAVPIPVHPDWMIAFQYRPPNLYSQKMLSAYARYVANAPEYRSETDPDQKVTGVKVYRVIHNMLMPKDLADGADPLDESLYSPYYMGEFDPDGTLRNPDDPFLYWLIPIYKVPKNPGAPPSRQEYVVENYLSVHAGDTTSPTARP